ncbi:MAG: hypothetical protein AB7D00_00430 [Rhodospirillaceae bacterium]
MNRIPVLPVLPRAGAPVLTLGIARETGDFVCLIELSGHSVLIDAPAWARTQTMLISDDAMDLVDLLAAGDADAADIAAEIAAAAAVNGITVVVDGKPLRISGDLVVGNDQTGGEPQEGAA